MQSRIETKPEPQKKNRMRHLIIHCSHNFMKCAIHFRASWFSNQNICCSLYQSIRTMLSSLIKFVASFFFRYSGWKLPTVNNTNLKLNCFVFVILAICCILLVNELQKARTLLWHNLCWTLESHPNISKLCQNSTCFLQSLKICGIFFCFLVKNASLSGQFLLLDAN